MIFHFPNWLKRFVLKVTPYNVLRILKNNFTRYKVYEQINRQMDSNHQPRVLISYLTVPYDLKKSKATRHTNSMEAVEIIKAYSERGYCIDLIHCLDQKHIASLSKKKYDIVFGLGIPFYQIALKNPQAKKIIYLTESHPNFAIAQENERINYFNLRHRKKAVFRRANSYYHEAHIEVADYAILVGNARTARTYSNMFNKIVSISPSGFINDSYRLTSRDCGKSRKNFVWFGSDGAIHKGLDILIDVFRANTECILYICGLNIAEESLFDINGVENIINLGFIEVDSDCFLRVMDECSFVVLPSCSEGMSTSVLTCMNHGLIPIISRESGVDLPGFGYYLESFMVDYVAKIIKTCSEMNSEELQAQHKLIFEYARQKFSLQGFSVQFQTALDRILDSGE